MENALTVRADPSPVPQPSFFALSPREMAASATAMANVLRDIIKQQRLSVRIGPNEYVKVEGWMTLGSFLRILPRESAVIEHANGDYEARVDLVKESDGRIVGGASGFCGSDEKRWASADRYARRSMAITRATGKAYRLCFAWIMTMAGYSATPYEEMPQDDEGHGRARTPPPKAAPKGDESDGFDPHDVKHQNWLIKQLKAKGVPEDRHDEVAVALKGKPASELDAVIASTMGAKK